MSGLAFLLKDHKVDAALISCLPDIRWASGFTGSNGLLVVTSEAVHFLSDGRYQEQARQEVKGAVIHIPGYDLRKGVLEKDLLGTATRVLYQADHLTVSQFEKWRGMLPSIDWVAGENLLDRAVAIKTDEEITRIRRAQDVTDRVFEHILGVIKPGLQEMDVAAEIVYQHLRYGASRMSFDPIVASGPRGALPHARPTRKRIQQGELVVLDFGCVVDGYASDMTRTIAVGEPGAKARTVYQVVLDAQRAAIDQAIAGVTTGALDRKARKVIEEAGYGPYFTHSLGHGIGLQTHEWPRVSYQTNDCLEDRMIITIEPGIYLPNVFGIRIEDLVVIGEEHCENLTASEKQLIVL